MIARFLTRCMLVLLFIIEIGLLTSLYHTLAHAAPTEAFSSIEQCPGGRSTPTQPTRTAQ